MIALTGLAIYFAISVTSLPAYICLVPLFLGTAALVSAPGHDPGHLARDDHSATLAFGIFLLSYLLSVVGAYNIPMSLNALGGLVPAFIIVYIVADMPATATRPVALCLSVLGCAASITVLYMFQLAQVSAPELVLNQLRTPSLVVPNDMLVAVVVFPAVLCVLLGSRYLSLRLAMAACLPLLLLALWLVHSRLVWLTLVLVVLILALHRWRPPVVLTVCGIIISCALLIDWHFQFGALDDLLRLRVENARISIWLAGLAGGMDYPVLGTGPGNFEIAYRLGLPRLDLPAWVLVEGRMVPWAHNLFVEAMVERGSLGLASLLLLLALIAKRLYSRWRSADATQKTLHFAVLVSFLAFLFSALFETTLQRIWVANLLCLYLGLVWNKRVITK